MKRLLETWGKMMLAEGIISAFFPKKHLKLWNFKRVPRLYRRTTKGLMNRPKLTRILGATEALLGAAVVRRALRKA